MKQPLSLLERYRLASLRLQQLWDEQVAHPDAPKTPMEFVVFGGLCLCAGFVVASASLGFGISAAFALSQLGLLP